MKPTGKTTNSWKLVAFMVVACIPMVLTGCNKARHYREYHDGDSLFAVLHSKIKAADGLERVESLLGKGSPPKSQVKLVKVLQKMAQVRPQGYPDGIKEDDQFVGFDGPNGSTIYLQFRDGKLINFDPKEFSRPPDVRMASQ